MPLFRSGVGRAPAWCEMEHFEIVRLAAGSSHTFPRLGRKEKLIVGRGQCRVSYGGQTFPAQEKSNFDLIAPEGQFQVSDVPAGVTLIRMCGRWGEETGGSGLFAVIRGRERPDAGDPVDYPKETAFDRHYHDCDEYWILFEGRGVAVSEGKFYEVAPGDCLATGMGHHHDFPQVLEPIQAVYFETTLEGQKRRGHLWEHTHGPAQPRPERV